MRRRDRWWVSERRWSRSRELVGGSIVYLNRIRNDVRIGLIRRDLSGRDGVSGRSRNFEVANLSVEVFNASVRSIERP